MFMYDQVKNEGAIKRICLNPFFGVC